MHRAGVRENDQHIPLIMSRMSVSGKNALTSVLVLGALLGARVWHVNLKKRNDLRRKTLYFEERGAGEPTVLLLHGLLGSHRYWTQVVPELSSRHRVVAVDLLGFGNSPKPELPYTVENHTSYIHCTLDEALPRRRHLILVGHSMGAILALNYAARFPRGIEGVVLINPPVASSPDGLKRDLEENMSALMRLMTFDTFWARLVCRLHELFPWLFLPIFRAFEPNLPKYVAEDTVRHTWESYSGSLHHILLNQKITELLAQVQGIPILIIGSTQDVHAKRADLDRLRFQSNVRVNVVEGRHDFLLHEPQVVTSAVADLVHNIGRIS
jgi:pimeloyl-ACP methyl ester carboxylesterase